MGIPHAVTHSTRGLGGTAQPCSTAAPTGTAGYVQPLIDASSVLHLSDLEPTAVPGSEQNLMPKK